MKKKIVILGASPDKNRYAYQALHQVIAKGMEPILVNPKYTQIDGFPVLPSLREVREEVDYLSVYLTYPILEKVIEDIVSLHPKQIILNPGADTPPALALLKTRQLPYLQACTLVLLSTGQIGN